MITLSSAPMGPLVMIFISLLLAYVLSILFRYAGLPRVIGEITAGLILGAAVLKGIIFTPDNLEVLTFLAELGVLLLFYYVGMQMDFSAFKGKRFKEALMTSVLKSTIPFVIGGLVSYYLLGLGFLPSIIVAFALAVSAQSVSVDLLEEMKMIKSSLGKRIVTTGTVDDILQVFLVTVLLAVFSDTGAQSFQELVFGITIFAIVILLARKWIVPFLIRFFDREKSSSTRFMGSLLIVILIASLAEYLGVGTLIGALIAGMVIRRTIFQEEGIPDWEERDIARSINIIAFGFLIPLFFVWIGVTTDLPLLKDQLLLPFIFFAIACLGILGTMVATRINGRSWRKGYILGWGLNSKGDIELVVAALALETAIITNQLFTAIVVMSFLTTIISPVMFKYLVTQRG